MNDVAVREKTMTVKEVAEALNVTDRTIQRHLKIIRGNCDNVVGVAQGKSTFVTELEATEIKKRIEKSGRTDLNNIVQIAESTTDYEIAQMTLKVIAHHQAKAKQLEAQLIEERQQSVALQIRLDEAEDWYSVKRMESLNPGKKFPWQPLKREAKRLGLLPRKVFDANYGEVNTYHISVWESLFYDTLNYEEEE